MIRERGKTHHIVMGSVLALPIFAASHPATIVGANELNFCVRDGNRWTLIAINTNFFKTCIRFCMCPENRTSMIFCFL